MLKIAVDCRKISDGGIGTYLKNPLRCWKNQNVEAQFYLFCHSRDLQSFEEFKKFATMVIHDYPKYSVREFFSFRKPLKKFNTDLFPKWSSKARIVHNGVDRSVFKPLPEEQVENFRKRHLLEKKFLLYVGTLKDHKNPRALATAVNELDMPLVVLTMDRKDFQQELLSKISNKILVKHIQLENQHDIALLYNSALLLFILRFTRDSVCGRSGDCRRE